MTGRTTICRTATTDTGARTELIVGLCVIPIALILSGVAALTTSIMGRTCGAKAWFGLCCPTCGSTRAFQLLLHGDIAGAFTMQPLAIATGLLALLYVVQSVSVLAFGAPVLLRFPRSHRGRKVLLALGALLVALNWAFLLIMGR